MNSKSILKHWHSPHGGHEMVQQVKCFPGEHWELCSAPRTHVNAWCGGACCHPCTLETRDRKVPVARWPAILACLWAPGRSHLKRQDEQLVDNSTAVWLWGSVCMTMYIHIHSHRQRKYLPSTHKTLELIYHAKSKKKQFWWCYR